MKPATKARRRAARDATSATPASAAPATCAEPKHTIDAAVIGIARVLFYDERLPRSLARQRTHVKRRLGFLPTLPQMEAAEWLIKNHQKAFRDPTSVGERRRLAALAEYAEAYHAASMRSAERWVKDFVKSNTPALVAGLTRLLIEHCIAEGLPLEEDEDETES